MSRFFQQRFLALLVAALVALSSCGQNEVTVKYRDSSVPVHDSSYFVSLGRDPAPTVKNAWYDSSENYMVITLKSTNYHYCLFPPAKWNALKKASSMDSYYLRNIKGKYDCRAGNGKYVPKY